MRVALIVVQRIPANVIAERNVEYDQRRTPPTAVPVISTARTPGPVVVVIDPTSVMIRRPTPRLLAHPGPTIRITPGPIAITIRRPVVVAAQKSCTWLPDPAVVGGVTPVAVGIKIFGAPNVAIVILNVVTQTFSQIMFALVDPIVPGI